MFIIPFNYELNIPLLYFNLNDYNETIIPIDFFFPNFDLNKLILFNSKPIDFFSEIIFSLGIDPQPSSIGKLLFFLNITPHSLSQIFFLSNLFSYENLFIFYTCPIIEFLGILNSIRCLISRIALPSDYLFL